jgi:hypothetical protein
MADRNIVMLASLSKSENECEETAIWGEGLDSELVVLCRELVGSAIDELESDDSNSGISL